MMIDTVNNKPCSGGPNEMKNNELEALFNENSSQTLKSKVIWN